MLISVIRYMDGWTAYSVELQKCGGIQRIQCRHAHAHVHVSQLLGCVRELRTQDHPKVPITSHIIVASTGTAHAVGRGPSAVMRCAVRAPPVGGGHLSLTRCDNRHFGMRSGYRKALPVKGRHRQC